MLYTHSVSRRIHSLITYRPATLRSSGVTTKGCRIKLTILHHHSYLYINSGLAIDAIMSSIVPSSRSFEAQRRYAFKLPCALVRSSLLYHAASYLQLIGERAVVFYAHYNHCLSGYPVLSLRVYVRTLFRMVTTRGASSILDDLL